MGRRAISDEHSNHEAWAIPYADLLVLLLAFFVVMYSISSVNEGQYRVLAETMTAAFRGQPRSIQPIPVGDAPPRALFEYLDLEALPGSLIVGPEPAEEATEPTAATLVEASDPADALAVVVADRVRDIEAGLQRMAAEVRESLGDLIDLEKIRVRESLFWLELELETDILFPSGSATINAAALPALTSIAEILGPFPNPIRVEGHTDNVPIATAAFPSNWELSAARAANVVRLFQGNGVAPDRLAAIGMGQYRPVADNDTAAGRNLNRRVLIVVLANETEVGVDALSGRYDGSNLTSDDEDATP